MQKLLYFSYFLVNIKHTWSGYERCPAFIRIANTRLSASLMLQNKRVKAWGYTLREAGITAAG